MNICHVFHFISYALVSIKINDAKNERIPKVNVPKQSWQSSSIRVNFAFWATTRKSCSNKAQFCFLSSNWEIILLKLVFWATSFWTKTTIWACPKLPKSFWSGPNHFGQVQINFDWQNRFRPIEGQGISGMQTQGPLKQMDRTATKF